MEREKEDLNFTNFNTTTNQFEINPLYTSDMDFKEDIHSVYSTYSGKLAGVQYMLGLRGEYSNRSIDHSKAIKPYTLERFDYFPSLHFSYDLAKQSQLMTSYSRRINRPDRRNQLHDYGQPEP